MESVKLKDTACFVNCRFRNKLRGYVKVSKVGFLTNWIIFQMKWSDFSNGYVIELYSNWISYVVCNPYLVLNLYSVLTKLQYHLPKILALLYATSYALLVTKGNS